MRLSYVIQVLDGNAAFGNSALYYNTGSNNTGLGYQAGYANTTGSDNTTIGSQSLRNTATGMATQLLVDVRSISNASGSHVMSLLVGMLSRDNYSSLL